MDVLTPHAVPDRAAALGVSSGDEADRCRAEWRQWAIDSLYFFSTAVLRNDKVQAVPHREICTFLQTIPRSRKVCLVPRDTFKSTLASKALPLWILLQPTFCGLPGKEHRMLLASHSSVNAQKQMKAIKHHVERNTLLQWLFPELMPDVAHTTWTDTNLLFPRDGVYGEDTIECAGLDTHIVSRHYTVQIHDDLEDQASAESPTIRQRVKGWYRASEALFVDERDAYLAVIGTRWGIDDLYADIFAHEADQVDRYVRPLHWTRADLEADQARVSQGRLPVYDMDPDVHAPDPTTTYFFFPELFPAESCARIRKKEGTWLYSMLRLNHPQDPALAEFKRTDFLELTLDPQTRDLLLWQPDGTREIVPWESTRRVLFWDPALSGSDQRHNARNAMVVVAKDRLGRLFILEAWAERKPAPLLFQRFIAFHRRYEVHVAGLEDIGFQRTLKYPLRFEMESQRHVFPVKELRPIGSKEARIRALIPYVEAQQVYVRKGLTDVLEEFEHFPLYPTNDLIDACAASVELHGFHVIEDEVSQRRALREETQRRATRSALTGY